MANLVLVKKKSFTIGSFFLILYPFFINGRRRTYLDKSFLYQALFLNFCLSVRNSGLYIKKKDRIFLIFQKKSNSGA